MAELDPKTFSNPPAEFRLAPFWFWNGTLEDGEIARQVGEMADKGIGGFCIAPLPGLSVPFRSKAWSDRVKAALVAASEQGLQVWLHEEVPGPTSLAGGGSLDRPEFQARHLTFQETTVQGGQVVDMRLAWATVLCCLAVPLKRDRNLWEDAVDISEHIGASHGEISHKQVDSVYHGSQYENRDPLNRLLWKAPSGRWRVMVFLQEAAPGGRHSAAHLDLFNMEAVQHYLRSASSFWEANRAAVEEGTIAGLITTEPSASRGDEETPSPRVFPWTSILPEAFERRNGYSLLKCLPALVANYGANTSRIRYDYFQTLSELQKEAFHQAFARWCNDHELVYASDVGSLRNAHRGGVTIPGTRTVLDKLGVLEVDGEAPGVAVQGGLLRDSARTAASLAQQGGASRVLSTPFEGKGWGLSLQDMKWTVDRQAGAGANQFHPRGFFYTVDGLRKHSAPPSQFQQNPYWKHYRRLADYVGRLSYLMSRGRRSAPIALVDPVTSLWAHMADPQASWTYAGSDTEEEKLVTRLVGDWAYLRQTLTRLHRDFDTLDPEQLLDADVVDGRMQVGEASYDLVMLPPMANMERNVFEVLRRYMNEGGRVVATSLLPSEDIEEGPSVVEAFGRMTDIEPGRMIKDYMGHEIGIHLIHRGNLHLIRTGGSAVQNRADRVLADVLDDLIPRRLVVQTEKKGAGVLLSQHRETENEQIFYLVNTSQSSFKSEVWVRPPSDDYGVVERWNLETGKREPLQFQARDGQIAIELPFQRLQSQAIVVSKGKTRAIPVSEPLEEVIPELKGQWKVDMEDDNALRLDTFRMQVDVGDRGLKQGWHKTDYADRRWSVVKPMPLESLLQEGVSLANLPLDHSDPENPVGIAFPLVCWYRATFWADSIPPKVSLVMDRSALLGEHQIYLNGSRIPGNAFRPTFRYDSANVTCAVGRRVTRGRNVIAIRVELEDLSQGLVDAVYLFGRFSVKKRNQQLRIAAPVDRSPIARLEEAGLPFYAGTVAFSRELSLPRVEGGRFVLSLDRAFRDSDEVLEVLINGQSLGVKPWGPFRWEADAKLLKKTRNRVTVKLTTSISRLICGTAFSHRSHKMLRVRV
jgi:hypothetical protein